MPSVLFDAKLFFDEDPDADADGAAIALLAATLVFFFVGNDNGRGGTFGRLSKDEIYFGLWIGTLMQDGSNFGGAGSGCFFFEAPVLVILLLLLLLMFALDMFPLLASEPAVLLADVTSKPVEGGGGIDFG